jgi:hypothetical protein
MRADFRVITLTLLGLALGCDSSVAPVAVSVTGGPHQGTMIRLPDDKGFVELTNEPEVADRRNLQPTSIVAYFIGADSKSPLTPAPTDVSFALEGARGGRGDSDAGAQAIPLSAEPKADDPSGSSRFVSKPGAYDLAKMRGTVAAKIDGIGISIPFSGAR